jgi:hypothetical protein
MLVHCINPILNVSNISESFEWFQKWGWKRLWDWGTPPTFGAIGAGPSEIFLSQDGQGGRGRGANTTTFDPLATSRRIKGLICVVDDVDEAYRQCGRGLT